MTKRQFPRVEAGHITVISKSKKRTNVVEREAEFAATPNEAQPLHLSLIVQAVPSRFE